MTGVDVCICTFRRKGVIDTLASLMEVEVPDGIDFGILVIDNDIEPSAQDIVEGFARCAPRTVRYIHCPAGNISIARNGALDASEARFVAFIDDDEIAAPGWLTALLGEQARTGADVVLGPVDARYGDGVPVWMRAAHVHATRPVWIGDKIAAGYTGNVLIDRTSLAIKGLRFDPALGRTGGEDTDFFSAVQNAGGRIVYAADAIVEETVLPDRLRFGWLARRKYRMGQTHAHVLLRWQGQSRWNALPIAAAKVAFCAATTVFVLPSRRHRNLWVLRGCLHAGVVAGLLGRDASDIYGSVGPAAGAPLND